MEATPDKDDSRSLHIVIQQPFTRRSKSGFNPLPVLTAKFMFDDYIRCMSARQRLQKRCDALRHRKMANIATLLELPALASPSSYYSITSSLDNSNAVWSPSSRGYSSSRNTSGYSSPVNSQPSSAPATPNPSTLPTPPSATKSRILSPKMEQILQRQQSTKTPTRPSRPKKDNKQTPLGKNSSRKEAVALASLLQTTPPLGPVEITGRADSIRQRSATMEVGEELIEDFNSSVTLSDSSTSFVLLNKQTSIEREVVNTPPLSSSVMVSEETEDNNSSTNLNTITTTMTGQKPYKNKSLTLDIRKNAAPSSKSQSAPSSPRGKRAVTERLSISEDISERRWKSLPAIELKSAVEERKQRAHRARVKAKNVRRMNNRGEKKK